MSTEILDLRQTPADYGMLNLVLSTVEVSVQHLAKT